MQSRAHFADLLFQKCPQHASFFYDKMLRACQLFRCLYEAEFSLQSHACLAAPPPKILRPHLPNGCPGTPVFYDFYTKSSSRNSRARILPTSSSKSVPNVAFNILKCKSTSRHSPVHFLSTTLPDRAPQPRKQRPSFGDRRSHITRKDTGFHARECIYLNIDYILLSIHIIFSSI